MKNSQLFPFQSYQGSIFTYHDVSGGVITVELSILSRFYFYFPWSEKERDWWFLSILSRFYFYGVISNNVSLLQTLSILSRFYFYKMCPIHKADANTSLSILSRFYFYWNPTRWKQYPQKLSILSRFYFYSYVSMSTSVNSWPFNPIKVLFLPVSDIE